MASFSISPLSDTFPVQYVEDNGIDPYFASGDGSPGSTAFAEGTIYYDSQNSTLYVLAGGQWRPVGSSSLPSGQTTGALLTATNATDLEWIDPPASIGAFLQYNALGAVPRWNIAAYTEYIWAGVRMGSTMDPTPPVPVGFTPNTLYALGIFEVTLAGALPTTSNTLTQLSIRYDAGAGAAAIHVATFQPRDLNSTMTSSTHLIPLGAIPNALGAGAVSITFTLSAVGLGVGVPVNASLKILSI